MSSLSIPPVNFQNANAALSKTIIMVVDIPGLSLLTSAQIQRPFEYGDVAFYGDGHVYGQMSPIGAQPGERGQQNLIDWQNSSLTISQQMEPEQGRGSISTMNISFVDKNSYMTQACSPGVIIPEILGQPVRIWIGYQGTSWPNDYYVVWRGRVGQVNADPGRISLQFVDPNVIRRQTVFYTAQTTTSLAVLIGDSNINVTDNSSFNEKITGPTGAYDQLVNTYIKIDDEFIEYQQSGSESTGFGVNQFVGVTRGARGTSAAAHAQGATVDAYIQLQGNIMDMALKIMLSGWGGPYLSGQAVSAFVVSGDPLIGNISNIIVLPAGVDAIRDLGLTVNDYFTTTGATNGGNDIAGGLVQGFYDVSGTTNNAIITNQTFTSETSSPALLAVRSQWDVWPSTCGCQLPGSEVDVQQFIDLKNQYLGAAGFTFQFLLNGDTAGKTFVENQLLLPVGAYSLTRQGKISAGLTKPPIADQRTQVLTNQNIIDPQQMTIQRGVNNRKYFNEIDWTFDYDDSGTALSTRAAINAASLAQIGISSVLPIDAQGARTSNGFLTIVANRESLLFQRYANACVLYTMKVDLVVGNLIEVGDVVVLQDNGTLNIPNFSNGTRNMGSIYVEVIHRQLDLKAGVCSLTLQSGLTEQITDRYATIAPSSMVTGASTASEIIITESYGSVFPYNEQKKWTAYVGLQVRVHSPDYTRDGTTVFTGFDPANTHGMLLSPALGFTPLANDIVDLAQYPTSALPAFQQVAKLNHAFLSPSPLVVSGSSSTVFTVASGDIAKFNVGMPIKVHDATFTNNSPETTIKAVNVGTDTVTVTASLGFTPTVGMIVELLGFADLGQPYRLV